MLYVNDLSVSYGNKPILDKLQLVLETKNIHGLVGLNGSGKTTLLNTLYGIVPFREGTIRWYKDPLTSSLIAYLETSSYFYSRITGAEYLSLFKARKPDFDIAGWNDLFHLPLQNLIETYSTGMKKKLSMLALLSFDRPLVLLDEPYNGLDIETNELVKMILLRLKEKGKTMLITSHIMESLTSVCDYIHYLSDGKIVSSYAKHDFIRMEQEIFGKIKAEKRTSLENLL